MLCELHNQISTGMLLNEIWNSHTQERTNIYSKGCFRSWELLYLIFQTTEMPPKNLDNGIQSFVGYESLKILIISLFDLDF